jgi:SET and MYND domain-containing protein
VERLRFLAHCQDLRFTKTPESFARLAAIDGLCPVIANDGTGIDEREHTAAGRLQPMLQQAVARCLAGSQVAPPNDAARGQDIAEFAFNQFTTATLLSKETKNAFGAMAPRDSVTGDRRVRGGALYNLASRVNHDCFPNTVRFDNFDGTLNDGSQFFNDGFEAMGTTANTFGNASSPDLQHFGNAPDELRLYALDKISAGTEITMSYLPVTEPLARRRRRLRNTFVFDCTCERCALETQWAIADGDRVGNCDEEFQLHSGTYLHFPNPNTVCPYKTDTFLFTI